MKPKSCMLCDAEGKDFRIAKIVFHKTRRYYHSLCISCLDGYLSEKIPVILDTLRIFKGKRDELLLKVKCPGCIHGQERNRCKREVLLLSLIHPKSAHFQILKNVELFTHPESIICRNKNCNRIFFLSPDFIRKKEITCAKCSTSWCRDCEQIPFHSDTKCANSFLGDSQILSLLQSGELKTCPSCNIPIMKNSGCSKMTCTNCHCKWCWLCSQKDIDYDHYNPDIGVCKNRLWEGMTEPVILAGPVNPAGAVVCPVGPQGPLGPPGIPD